MKVLFTGGGTGGHIFPIVAVAREIKKINPEAELIFIGPGSKEFDLLLQEEGIKIKRISTGKIRRYSGFGYFLQNVLDLFFRVPLGIIQSFFYIFFLSPDLIFSKGGHGAFPAIISAKMLQVPVFIHESDIVPGVVNKKSSRQALEIFTSFPETEFFPVEKMILVGNPIRADLIQNIDLSKFEEKIGFQKTKPVLLAMGGSQGSERINDLVLSVLPNLLSRFQVIHQCGHENFKGITVQADFLIPKNLRKNYYLFPFLTEEQLKYVYCASDIVVSRAGSGSIFEIAAFEKPSILIPLPESAQGHQLKNAYFYAKFGAATILEEENITSHLFEQKVSDLLGNSAEIKEMARKAKEFSRPRSAKVIAGYIVEFLNQ